jgi:hypothetical protein
MPYSGSSIIESARKKLKNAKNHQVRIIYAKSRLEVWGEGVEKVLEWVLERLRAQLTARFWKIGKR